MHHGFALRYIAEAMRWPTDIEEKETAWLRLMSEFKYDSYHDFLAGSRFVEALLDWLQQFDPADRQCAYRLLKDHLIFITTSELQHLVRRAYPAHIHPCLEDRVARKLNISKFLLGSSVKSLKALHDMAMRTLFIGLSDGARLDYFRRANSGLVSNEQVIATPEIADEKWQNVHAELKKATGDQSAVFEIIVLLDDFTASGTSLLWQKSDKPKGKLVKTCLQLKEHAASLAKDYDVVIHHYMGTSKVQGAVRQKLNEARSREELAPLFKGQMPVLSFGMVIPDEALLRRGTAEEIDRLLDDYYDQEVMTDHLKLGGDDVKHGFAGSGLPMVLEHNTPNNSLGILWAESPPDSKSNRLMRPLFRRRQRHV